MKKYNIIMALAAVAVWCAGCVVPPPNNVPPMDRRVTIAENLGTDLYVTDIRCGKVDGSKFLTLQANVVNNTYSQLLVEWKTVWLNADGMEINSVANGWNRRGIQPKEVFALQSVAPAQDAADMRIYIRKMN